MSYKPRTLFRLIEEINQSLFLPHIQRPFIWSEEQMKRLYDSLMRNYPIQTFLFWRTRAEIKARHFMSIIDWDIPLSKLYEKNKSAEGIEKVFVLDGQQRIQSLYALFNGKIKAENGNADLEAYGDLTSGKAPGEDGIWHNLVFSLEPMSLPMYRLRDLSGRHSQKNAARIGNEVNEELDKFFDDTENERGARQDLVRENIGQLVSILREEKHFWIEELDGVANDYPYKRVLEIFVRVNSGGTKLDAADLMFAAMKEGWSDIEENVEEVVSMLNSIKLNFDKAVVLKCILVSLGNLAQLNPNDFSGPKGEKLLKAIQSNWDQLNGAFDQLRDFIANDLHLFGDKVVRSYNSFVPLFDYLFHNPKTKPKDIQLMIGYYYKSQLFNWYGRQTDGVINAMHGIVGKPCSSGFPLKEVKDYFGQNRRYDVELLSIHLMDHRLRFIILNLIYVSQFGTSPFNVRFRGNEPHIDHIYPKTPLQNQLGLLPEEINHLGNYRFVGSSENLRKRAELPREYFSRLKSEKVPIKNHLMLSEESEDPGLLHWDVDNYRNFRDRRLGAILKVASGTVNPEKN